LRRDDQATLDLSGVHQPIENETRLDRLTEPDLVCEQPPDGLSGCRPLGYVQLVWKEAHPAAKKRPQAVRLPDRQELQAFQTCQQFAAPVYVTRREPFQTGPLEGKRPQLVSANHEPVAKAKPSILETIGDRRFLACCCQSNRPAPA
jgi:hypothetical protein